MGTTDIGSITPVELTFADGVFVNAISGTSDVMVNSLKFTSSDGNEIECGAPGMGDAFDAISGYLIGIDGHFSEYLDRTAMKTIPVAAAQALL